MGTRLVSEALGHGQFAFDQFEEIVNQRGSFGKDNNTHRFQNVHLKP